MDLFQLLSSQMDWSGVDYLWIIVIFLSFFLSFFIKHFHTTPGWSKVLYNTTKNKQN